MCSIFRFRDKGVTLGTRFAPFGTIKDGKLYYASTEKLYQNQNAFLIPKSSPLNASKIVDINCVLVSEMRI